jgi:plasmid stability protein
MGSILIRRIDEETKSRLRIWAARNGHSMEQEARDILGRMLARDTATPMRVVDAIRPEPSAVVL